MPVQDRDLTDEERQNIEKFIDDNNLAGLSKKTYENIQEIEEQCQPFVRRQERPSLFDFSQDGYILWCLCGCFIPCIGLTFYDF